MHDSSAAAPVRETTPWRWSWLVLGLIALVYVGTCFAPVIFDDNEGLYAGAVREMHARGDWLLPTTNGFPRIQKPPLIYWTMLVSTTVFGWNEFALRLPNALATTGWIVATYLIMRRLGGERFGTAAALILATMIGVPILFAHLVQPEPFLSCFISLAIWCLVEARFEENPARRWYLLFWLFLGLGAMCKGVHGALWPLGTVALTAIFVPGMRPWLRPILDWRGVAIFLAILLPWYVYMTLRLPGFLSAHFLNEQLGASLNTRYPVDAKQLPLGLFYAQHFLFWMPWTLLLPGAIYAAVKARGVAEVSAPRQDIIRMLVCWFALVLVTVAFSTRQDYYTMSSWGVVAGFLAIPWLMSARIPKAFLLVPCAILAASGAVGLALVPWLSSQVSTLGEATATPIAQRNTLMDALVGISPALWGKFIPMLGVFGITMLIAGGVATWLTWRRRGFPALVVLAGAMAVPICLATAGFAMMSPFFSLAEEARAINAEIALKPDAVVACEALPNTASSLYYYLNARVHWVNAPFKQDYAQRMLGLGHEYYFDDAQLAQAWRSAQPVYLIIEQERQAHWQELLPPGVRVVNKSGTRLVLCNH